jgi:hypothetical protein
MDGEKRGRVYYNLMTPAQREEECRRRGWFAYFDEETSRWVRCPGDDPRAEPDLNRLDAYSRMGRSD